MKLRIIMLTLALLIASQVAEAKKAHVHKHIKKNGKVVRSHKAHSKSNTHGGTQSHKR